ncbi:MAG: DUF4178 domain-containing protein [Clostridiales bacterium]|nr:DUF4178 domain-containing protein [Clostridiales bacterium]
MEDLLNLEYKQQIIIENSCYEVLSMLKFIEGSSYWIEYILKKENDGQMYYLDVEPIGKCALHKMVNEKYNIELEIHYNGKLYGLFQKGNAKIQTYFGYTDVSLNEQVEYYEYICGNNLFTIEKWKNQLEISEGKYINKNKIKIKKTNEDNFRI